MVFIFLKEVVEDIFVEVHKDVDFMIGFDFDVGFEEIDLLVNLGFEFLVLGFVEDGVRDEGLHHEHLPLSNLLLLPHLQQSLIVRGVRFEPFDKLFHGAILLL
jgi:hypothetical protein